MNVLAITIFVGIVLVALFVFLFIVTASGRTNERDALLPLDEERPNHQTPGHGASDHDCRAGAPPARATEAVALQPPRQS